jgi:hypothetical protein
MQEQVAFNEKIKIKMCTRPTNFIGTTVCR